MYFRIAKPQDAKKLAAIHHRIKDVNANGIFVMMGEGFLRRYYKLVLSDPCSVCLCAEDSDGKIVGYAYSVLDSEGHQKYLMRHKWQLIGAAIGTVLSKVWLLKELYARYRSLKSNDAGFITAHGARGGFWGWAPECPDSVSSFELHERLLAVVASLGVKELFFEVDKVNKHVYKFHKMNGAQELQEIELSDGRRRALMTYDLTTHKFKMI